MIVDVHGNPLVARPRHEEKQAPDVTLMDVGDARAPIRLRSTFSDVAAVGADAFASNASYLSSESGLASSVFFGGGSAVQRSLDSFRLHPYVFAAARAIAVASMQAPLAVFRDQKDDSASRRFGRARCGIARYSRSLEIALRAQTHGSVEPSPEHPLSILLRRPNDLWSGVQLQMATVLNLTLNGSVLWALCSSDGGPAAPGQIPDEIWVIPRGKADPIHRQGYGGPISQWRFTPPKESPIYERAPGRATFPADSMILFSEPDPDNPILSLKKLSTLLATTSLDFDLRSHSRGLLKNSAEPGGVLLAEGQVTEEQKDRIQEKWNQRHAGPANARKIAILSEGMTYHQIGLSQKDLENRSQLEWDRDEILAVIGTPPSILGLTEFTNYATALAQRLVFWEQTVRPIHALIEETVEASPLFATQPDSVIAMFDITGVDALRANQSDKIESARALSGSELHMPPKDAFSVVGLDAPSYEGDDEAGGKTPAALLPGEPGPPPGADPDDTPANPDQDIGVETPVEPRAASIHVRSRQKKKRARHEEYLAVHSGIEGRFSDVWRAWVGQQKTLTMKRLKAAQDAVDETSATRSIIKRAIDPDDVVPGLGEMSGALAVHVRPVFVDALDITFGFTLTDLGGIATFEPDSDTIMAVLNHREEHLVTKAPSSLRARVVNEMNAALNAGESLAEMRRRIGRAYAVASGDHKTLTVARTETGSFMNEMRDAMFEEAEVEMLDWSSAADEAVRDSHVKFDKLGPLARGTNYMEKIGKEGSLHFPNDSSGPASEVINCRCVHLPSV